MVCVALVGLAMTRASLQRTLLRSWSGPNQYAIFPVTVFACREAVMRSALPSSYYTVDGCIELCRLQRVDALVRSASLTLQPPRPETLFLEVVVQSQGHIH